jgi:hypothetical protein
MIERLGSRILGVASDQFHIPVSGTTPLDPRGSNSANEAVGAPLSLSAAFAQEDFAVFADVENHLAPWLQIHSIADALGNCDLALPRDSCAAGCHPVLPQISL